MPSVYAPDSPQLAPIVLEALFELSINADAIFQSPQQLIFVLLESGPVLLDGAIFGRHSNELGIHAGWMYGRIVQHYNFICQTRIVTKRDSIWRYFSPIPHGKVSICD